MTVKQITNLDGFPKAADRRAIFRPQSGARRHASDLVAERENVHKRYLVHVAGHNLGWHKCDDRMRRLV